MTNISPITLGTVQLGINYGIANAGGKPDRSVCHAILEEALQCGITTWDTARSYGESEEVIGEFLAAAEPRDRAPLLVTKFKWSKNALTNLAHARQECKDQVRQSLTALGIPMLPILLYHKGMDEPIEELMRFLSDVMTELKEEGMIQTGGISLYSPNEIDAIPERSPLQAVQVPVSVFDQRAVRSGGLKRLNEMGTVVFARSAFLQGLFFVDDGMVPAQLKEAVPFLQKLRQLARKADKELAQFAFSFVSNLEGVTSVVLGTEHPDQVRQNAALLHVSPLPAEILEEAFTAFGKVPLKIITPAMW